MIINIYDQILIYKNTDLELTYDVTLAESCLPVNKDIYKDILTGELTVEEFVHVGSYTISRGTLIVGLPLGNGEYADISENYNFIVTDGTLEVVQREIIVKVKENQSKIYGEFDPVDGIEFVVVHKGVDEELPIEHYEGKLSRVPGETPDRYYTVHNEDTNRNPADKTDFPLRIHNFGDELNRIEDYLIIGWDFTNEYFIEKRDLTITVSDVEAIYGNDYSKYIRYTTDGGLANNQALRIDPNDPRDYIKDKASGGFEALEIQGPVDGVGEYVISCENIRIIRDYNGEDVTDTFYNFTCNNGTLTILSRDIIITVTDRQSKLYGENDPDGTVCEVGTPGHGFCFTYDKEQLMEDTDHFVGNLVRESLIINGVEVREDANAEYPITLGSLKIETASGKPNYNLIINGSPTFIILKRTLAIKAKDIEINYGDPYSLNCDVNDPTSLCEISGDGLAKNPSLGIDDKITGSLKLDRPYTGAGTYRILGDDLAVSNLRNYNYTFTTGLLIVNQKIVWIAPSPDTSLKVYGDQDPESFAYTTDILVACEGFLTREVGEDAGKYAFNDSELKCGDNYEARLVDGAYFTIIRRVIEVIALDTEKIFGETDPIFEYIYVGKLIGNDKFVGTLTREHQGNKEIGENVGTYEILQGSLTLGNNYQINYTPAIFTIRYAELTDIIIKSLTNNQHQIQGEEEEVKLYAEFNPGADETNIGSVVWTVKQKDSQTNEEIEYLFIKDSINNIISFTPEAGKLAVYTVSASYGGITGYYDVFVEVSTSGNVYIMRVSGETRQILGAESELQYAVIVPASVSKDAWVQWIVNDATVAANPVSNIYFNYTPNLGIGTYRVQAKIGNKISDELYFYVDNNNPPVITLNGNEIVYVEARTGAEYKEEYATVIDDIDGDISRFVRISGYVDCDTIGQYYIKYDAVDSHGNHAVSVHRQVIVRDTTPPVVTLNGNSDIVLLYGQEYKELYATAVDNYDGPVSVSIENPVVIDKIGSYEIVYSAYDKSHNRGVAIRRIEVIDNISPLITLNDEQIMYVEVHEKFEDPGANVIDNVDGNFTIYGTSFYYGDIKVKEIDTSKLGTYYVRYDYTDSAGNIGAGQMRTVIVRDTTAPVITLNGSNPYLVRYISPTVNGYIEPGATAIDNYDGEVNVHISGFVGNETDQTYYVYYNAVDSNGNIATTVERIVIIVDLEDPVIEFINPHLCPQYMTLEALYDEYDTRCDMPGYGINVEDNYDVDKDYLESRVVVKGTVDTTTVGLYIISYDVMDKDNNPAITVYRYVNVVDTTAPVLTLNGGGENGDQISEVFHPYEELGVAIYDRYDLYHNIVIIPEINAQVNVNKLGEYIVTYRATDSNGNESKIIMRRVFVKDTTPPVVTLIGDSLIVLERGTPYIDLKATAVDNYDGPLKIGDPEGAPTGMSLGTFTVYYRAVDSSGNVGVAIRTVIVQDTIPPVVLGVEDGKYYKNPVTISFIPTVGTDEVLTATLNGVEIKNRHHVTHDGEYYLLVKDDAGNKTEIHFFIDRLPPVIQGVRNGEYTNRNVVEVYADEKVKYFEYRYQNGEWKRTEEQSISFTEEGVYRIYAVDMADNISDVVMFTIDRTAPIYNLVGVVNKGIAGNDVHLMVEPGAATVVNALYNVPESHTFASNGYYQVAIRDLAGNTVNLQFVVNKSSTILVNKKEIAIITQHNAIDKISIAGTTYPRNTGYMLVKPLIEGGFEYVSGKLFSETEYQALMQGETLEYGVSPTDDTYMFAAFVVTGDELNKFETTTVDDEKDKDSGTILYLGLLILLLLVVGFFALIFLKRRKREEDELDEVEEVVDDY